MQLTKAIIRRVDSRKTSLFSPCVICGVVFSGCPHDSTETEFVIKQVKGLSREARVRVLQQK